MPKIGEFGVELVVGGQDGKPEQVLDEVVDITNGRTYAISRAGDEYKIRMSGGGDKHVGAILQIDGTVPCQPLSLLVPASLAPTHCSSWKRNRLSQ
jgi:hypothetical protein